MKERIEAFKSGAMDIFTDEEAVLVALTNVDLYHTLMPEEFLKIPEVAFWECLNKDQRHMVISQNAAVIMQRGSQK